MPPAVAGQMDFLPGHNSSYKREILLQYGDRLEKMLESETLLHWDLRKRGHRLLHEPKAVVAHTHFSLWRSFVPMQFHVGRSFAGYRIQGMSTLKRGVFIVGSPLIPLVRLARIARLVWRKHQLHHFAACAHAIVIGLGSDGTGQFIGYLIGPGHSRDRVAQFEYRRSDHITNNDRKDIYGGG